MGNIVIDMGNTQTKAAIFKDGSMIWKGENTSVQAIAETIQNFDVRQGMICSVAQDPYKLINALPAELTLSVLSPETKVPFLNRYTTPQTLGMDRVAGVCGAMQLFPDTNCLVIDAGTCVTYDFITADRNYLGGAISPGLHMRLKAMHHFTAKLPELQIDEAPDQWIGDSTKASMLSGAYFGMLGEINEMIRRYEDQFGSVQPVICGGDAHKFDKRTKKNIFAAPDLVLVGLNHIIESYAQ